MSYIECMVRVMSSHDLEALGLRGGNRIELAPLHVVQPWGLAGAKLDLQRTYGDDDCYRLIFTLPGQLAQDTITMQLERIADWLTVLINRRELNPHYGTCYAAIDWLSVRVTPRHDPVEGVEHLTVSDSVRLLSTRQVQLDPADWLQASADAAPLRFYTAGLRDRQLTSKYFHWFLILEWLEGTPAYREQFPSGTLFTGTEREAITTLAATLAEPGKGALLALLNRTRESRAEKLKQRLHAMGIEDYPSCQHRYEVTASDLKKLIAARNRLFHSGASFPEALLWFHLFPLVTRLVEQLACDV